MVGSEVNSRAERRKRSAAFRRWTLFGLLAASLLANLALLSKITIFDPNYPLKPVCFTEADGLVILEQPMSKAFKSEMAEVYHSSPRWANDRWQIYVSRWHWWNEKETIWNYSRGAAETLHRRATGGKPPPTNPLRRSNTCWFIAKYALE